MAAIVYSEQAFADLNRLTEFLLQADSVVALETIDLIIEAVEVLANHPLIGHLAEQELRELVISRGKTGYLALYSYELEQDTVLVFSIRHQREAGYVSE
ncbi:MAG: type II toxin-antitoxin system RelE/ParE family toxin [Nitrococcus sp.]|nr:type II toxin-antitoxin system RelE/ParE family toxin [Nitrococcus sp.]